MLTTEEGNTGTEVGTKLRRQKQTLVSTCENTGSANTVNLTSVLARPMLLTVYTCTILKQFTKYDNKDIYTVLSGLARMETSGTI